MVQQATRETEVTRTRSANKFVAGAANNQGHYLIRVPPVDWFQKQGIVIPGYVWRTPKFVFRPNDYFLEHPRLQRKEIDSFIQLKSLAAFIENPTYPGTYGVGSDPTDGPALYFAAYLAATFLSLNPRSVVKWHSLLGFKNTLLEEGTSEHIDLLIITNVTEQSSPHRIEMLRDLLVRYADIPKVVVIGGEDPVTFFSTKLHMKLTHLFFNSGSLIKRQVEVV